MGRRKGVLRRICATEIRSFVNGLLFMAGFLMRDKFIEGGANIDIWFICEFRLL